MTNEERRRIYREALEATGRLEEATVDEDITPEEYDQIQDEWLAALNRLTEAIAGTPRVNRHRATILVFNPNKFYHLEEYVPALA